ncbi:AbrB family transcriptional regulator [Frankia sp. AiPs1]|uniref:AbrB family transcriptional regulator n=1 Tax=Frankia sp. AiPs1 TaxID=573493 RepID=UPI0035AC1216
MIGIPFLESYLATTPGGINAVLATATVAHINVGVVSTGPELPSRPRRAVHPTAGPPARPAGDAVHRRCRSGGRPRARGARRTRGALPSGRGAAGAWTWGRAPTWVVH